MSEFQAYQRFPNVEVAQPLLHLLYQHGIPYETKLDQPSIDPSFAFNATSTYFLVLVRPHDFEAVRKLELDTDETLTAQAPANHYLFTFSHDELMEVLLKPDEWSSFDVALARRILGQRGHEVHPPLLEHLHQQRRLKMARPEPRQQAWVALGYLAVVGGGILAVLIGWHLYAHHKTLPDGQQVPSFQAPDRASGLRLMVLGSISFVVWLAYRFYQEQ
ncbi:hypothetical protein [Hymenobacter sp. AT01-02]|uniref:hypothetical protein n=1 Tax=Hymenobacter sp. AT01-02 TaxID=1571877 RepID=UPI0005F134B0|nr:hypothetical protein [Hymenobacter sp. AT01-02]